MTFTEAIQYSINGGGAKVTSPSQMKNGQWFQYKDGEVLSNAFGPITASVGSHTLSYWRTVKDWEPEIMSTKAWINETLNNNSPAKDKLEQATAEQGKKNWF